MTRPLLLHRGDAQHGVDRCARALAEAAGRLDPGIELRRWDDAAGADRVHLHFTDRLWGSSAADAATAVESLAAAALSVTLHDIPQPSDGEAAMRRRSDAYRRVVEAAAVVVCNSRHERRLLREAIGIDVDAEVIPLPAAAPPRRPVQWRPRAEIGILGFFYPGKGHREAVDVAAALDPPIAVTAIGRAAPGHDRELAELERYARERGVALTSTGFLSDEALLERARESAVPVVAHQHVSASGSLNDWLAAGRRPVTIANDYFAEMAALRPGTVELVAPDELASAVAAALRDPASTWLPEGASTSPHLDDVAAAYLARWARW